jgi:hypothetical protein
MLSVIMANFFMLNVANNPFVLSNVMLTVIMLNVAMPSVVAYLAGIFSLVQCLPRSYP